MQIQINLLQIHYLYKYFTEYIFYVFFNCPDLKPLNLKIFNNL